MAYNAASHNSMGAKTGPVTGQPPPLSEEAKDAITGSANGDSIGQHAPGQDGGDKQEGEKMKSEKELEKERKKAEKAKKFSEKQAKTQKAPPGAVPSKNKEKKAKQDAAKEEPLPEYIEETQSGHRKILKPLDDQFHKAYIPKVVESGWYAWWEKEGFFKPELGPDGNVKEEGQFSIAIPPPNVTGALHMGHALTNALQDTMTRWNRMHGKSTLWLPGCDHAGIATQNVIENMLWRRKKQTRHDLGRTKFVETAWEWKEDYHKKINNALRRMGASVDWSREAFTMDENLSAAVTETFVRLHEEGLIYRANRLVNWCTKLNTAISSLEVVNKDLEGRTLLDVPGYDRKIEFGVITHFRYPIEGSDETIEVATTRPETMLGDSGVAVNPKDERYKHLVGKKAKHPFINRLLPIFADDYVDMEFGTGAVKITPAHDANDFALGQRHNLEFINILNDDGTLNHNTGSFNGTKRFDARYEVIVKLKEVGLYVKWENNPMRVPICDRSKDVIEPLMKPQWWMKMQGMADAAAKAVREGDIKIRPETAEKSYLRWMDNVNDWCLSRQLWWGHQAPAYFIKIEGERGDDSDGELWVTGRTEDAAQEKAAKKFPNKNFTLVRDEDVLDTWFSSGLWPFSTLGWPKETQDMKNFYPTSVLETGWDIIFFWVARMVMFGLKLTGKVPFKEVYCHSLVRDSEGRKMSKSLGNVIDPLDVMEGIPLQALHDKLLVGNLDPKELATATKFQKTSFPDGIPECGADALRFSLVSYTTGGGDIAFDVKVMHGYRRFCNKIYQATKFVLGKLDDGFVPQYAAKQTGQESLAEKWILHKLTIAAKEMNQALADREFARSADTVYHFWYNHLCDVFIENSKSIIQDGTPEERRSAKDTLYTALEGGLTMIHPMMPFLTEELWQRLPRRPGDKTPSIVKAAYPVYQKELDNPASEAAYELLLGVSKGIRSLMAEYSLKDEGTVYVQAYDETSYETAKDEIQSIKSLSGKGVSTISVLSASEDKPTGCVVFAVSSSAAVFLHVKGRVDIQAEINKAQAKMWKASEGVKRQEKILEDPDYRKKVGEELQEVERRKLRDLEAEMRGYEETVMHFEQLKTSD
ncbi:MAG: hypothetical protein M1827_004677 [Pycnora praestabilis]|nr:MAG: hypothetical protein M1827_004677 [Pycnora praestabilis]